MAIKHIGGGTYRLSDGTKVKGKAAAMAAEESLGKATKRVRKTAPKTSLNPGLKTTTKKPLDDMSDAHRRKIERWEPLLSVIGAQHIWASTPRFVGRGDGPFFLAVKRGAKDYAIVAFDTSQPKVKPEVIVEGIASPKVILDEFKTYRVQAKAERDAARSGASSQPTEAAAKTPAKRVRKTKAS